MTKRPFYITLTLVLSLFWEGCNKAEQPAPYVPVNYITDIKPILVANCTPCHVAGGTQTKKWDDFATAKANILLILDRVQRDKNATGAMPRGKDPLPMATITTLKQWYTDGLVEK